MKTKVTIEFNCVNKTSENVYLTTDPDSTENPKPGEGDDTVTTTTDDDDEDIRPIKD